MSTNREDKTASGGNYTRYGCYSRAVGKGTKAERETEKKDSPPPEEPFFNGKDSPKKRRKIYILDQWVEITIDETGKTITQLYPSNEDLIKDGHQMWPPPELVYRRLHFVHGVRPEYYWATSSPQRRAAGGMGTQRMTVNTWLETIKREKESGTGHIGPCSAPLPRPPERGGCDCPVCTALTQKMEAESQAEA